MITAQMTDRDYAVSIGRGVIDRLFDGSLTPEQLAAKARLAASCGRRALAAESALRCQRQQAICDVLQRRFRYAGCWDASAAWALAGQAVDAIEGMALPVAAPPPALAVNLRADRWLGE